MQLKEGKTRMDNRGSLVLVGVLVGAGGGRRQLDQLLTPPHHRYVYIQVLDSEGVSREVTILDDEPGGLAG